VGPAREASTRAVCCRDRDCLFFGGECFSGHGRMNDKDGGGGRLKPRQGAAWVIRTYGELHTDVMTCFPHSSTPKRPSVCAFHEATERRDRVDVMTTKPEMSPEYMRSLSPEMNSALTAELCERIICSGGGAEAGADIKSEKSGALGLWYSQKSQSGSPQ